MGPESARANKYCQVFRPTRSPPKEGAHQGDPNQCQRLCSEGATKQRAKKHCQVMPLAPPRWGQKLTSQQVLPGEPANPAPPKGGAHQGDHADSSSPYSPNTSVGIHTSAHRPILDFFDQIVFMTPSAVAFISDSTGGTHNYLELSTEADRVARSAGLSSAK